MTVTFAWNVPGSEPVCFTGPFGTFDSRSGSNPQIFVLNAPTSVDPCNLTPAYLWVNFTITVDGDCDKNQTNSDWSYGMSCQ